MLMRDKTFVLNQLFSIATVCIGLFSLMVGSSNLPILLLGEGQLVSVTAMQLAYLFLLAALMLFFLTSLYIEFGPDSTFQKKVPLSLVMIYLVNLVVVLLPGSIYINLADLGDVFTTILFKGVYYSSSVIFFLLTFLFYFKTYRSSEGITKERMRAFLICLALGGSALIASVLSDFLRELDLLQFIVLSIAMIVLWLGIRKKEPEQASASQ